ncbi:hypothetical protein EF847_12680 [Actinobacteria bacterium YIM 96077]|uniref:Uncharacterized protein n=1 Tax=Phytoactinopolyspora halophila TaxID=1981511 RepID=A0A329R2X7_9ACTN|nr:hypothetical protein [Phytoactinopolyspora halophila]AYY13417.1 hypothetical protein EF847_12680 [Actinobacteria bacterium YIM 96077]RAW17348.1 hypothetical protein DPM12_04755 [Phytoactinopolyspora halophila]
MTLKITPTRRGVGALIALLGAIAVAASAYPAWYRDEGPRDWPLMQLFQANPAGTVTAYWGSVAAPLAVVGLLGILGAALRFRFILGLGWLIGTATFILWSAMRAIDGEWRLGELQRGAWIGLVGLLVVLIGLVVMGPRHEEVEAPLSVFDDKPPE